MARLHLGSICRLGSLFLLLGILAGRKAAAVVAQPKVQPCSSKKSSSAIAVSVVFAECQGDAVLAAERCRSPLLTDKTLPARYNASCMTLKVLRAADAVHCSSLSSAGRAKAVCYAGVGCNMPT